MPVRLDQAVPWGRSYDEYAAMFALAESELKRTIFDCAAGPSSFNAEMHARGRRVVSADPIYAFTADDIRRRVEATRGPMMEQVRGDPDHFVWRTITSPEMLERLRMSAMERFLADFEQGRPQGRYATQELATLSFPDASFELALCSHFLFLYSSQLSQEFHIDSVRELRRVAREVRLFPVLNLEGRPSEHLDAVRAAFDTDIVQVDYEFLKGANQMLVVR